jgi:hypothetical protein
LLILASAIFSLLGGVVMSDTTQGVQSAAERARRDLIAWFADESVMTPLNASRWYKGSTHRRLPDKAQLSTLGMENPTERPFNGSRPKQSDPDQ